MANHIADFFRPYTHDEQVIGVRRHLLAFWSPVMKRDLVAHISTRGSGLRPVVIEAASTIPKT